jgi:glycosyltransferase involved in cell wall biosynthesis
MKLLTLIKTTGLEYDDRLRKEMLSLQQLGLNIHIVALEYQNVSTHQIVYGGIPATTVALRSRRWFARTKGLPVKAFEMYWRFLVQVMRERPDIIWLHNLELKGLVPFLALLRKLGYVKQIIWDQHELPSDAALNSSGHMVLLGLLMNWCDVIVMANGERKELIEKIVANKLQTPIKILHNYPDQLFRQLPRTTLPQQVLDWLQNTPYLLAQGGATPDRHLPELVEAIMQQSAMKLIVIGPYKQQQLESLGQEYGEVWREKVFFTGFVPQLEITPYIDQAVASIVFYTTNTSNSRLCAPNRLYQAISRGIPVIVGPNPPMKSIIEKFGCGIIVEHNSPQSILKGIEAIKVYQNVYQNKTNACTNRFVWERQQIGEYIIHSSCSKHNR